MAALAPPVRAGDRTHQVVRRTRPGLRARRMALAEAGCSRVWRNTQAGKASRASRAAWRGGRRSRENRRAALLANALVEYGSRAKTAIGIV